jgi:hypothetical protein
MKKSLDGKVHCWEGLSEYKLNQDDFINSVELGIEGIYNLAQNLKANQYFIARIVSPKLFAANYFDKCLNELKSLGLDIGKGDSEYGYKMPLPEKREDERKLIIFRRK